MKLKIEGKELIVKKLFGEKRYSFREVTRLVEKGGIFIYVGDKCIFKEKNVFKMLEMPCDLDELARENGWIFETTEYFSDEIPVGEVHSYGKQVSAQLQAELQEYVNEKLGEEYKLVVCPKETPYRVHLYFDIYLNGEQMCMDDAEEVRFYTDTMHGKNEFHLSWFELVEPEYINPRKQEFRITKYVDFAEDVAEIKGQIHKMNACGIVPVSKFIH